MGHLVIEPEGPALRTWPAFPSAGERVHIAFLAPVRVGGNDRHAYTVTVHDLAGRKVATVVRGKVRPVGGVVCVAWDGRGEGGGLVAPGRYLLRVVKDASSFSLERTISIGS